MSLLKVSSLGCCLSMDIKYVALLILPQHLDREIFDKILNIQLNIHCIKCYQLITIDAGAFFLNWLGTLPLVSVEVISIVVVAQALLFVSPTPSSSLDRIRITCQQSFN
jgi:hypothetical protein